MRLILLIGSVAYFAGAAVAFAWLMLRASGGLP